MLFHYYLLLSLQTKCCAMNCMECFTNVTGITGKLCNKCPKWQVEQNCSSSDSFNVICHFTLNSRAPGGPVAFWHPIRDQRLPKLQNCQNCKMCYFAQNVPKLPKNVQSPKVQKSPKTALSGLANKVPERSVSGCCVSVRVSG